MVILSVQRNDQVISKDTYAFKEREWQQTLKIKTNMVYKYNTNRFNRDDILLRIGSFQ